VGGLRGGRAAAVSARAEASFMGRLGLVEGWLRAP
jgi:hypothetical protein